MSNFCKYDVATSLTFNFVRSRVYPTPLFAAREQPNNLTAQDEEFDIVGERLYYILKHNDKAYSSTPGGYCKRLPVLQILSELQLLCQSDGLRHATHDRYYYVRDEKLQPPFMHTALKIALKLKTRLKIMI